MKRVSRVIKRIWLSDRKTGVQHTLESLLCGCGISTSTVEVVASTDGYNTATDLESSGHVVGCCDFVMLFVFGERSIVRIR
jgi:hypothetical protein